jgi:hypothetical protein
MIDQVVMVAGTLELELMCRLKHFEPTEVLNMWHKALLELPVSAKLLMTKLSSRESSTFL